MLVLKAFHILLDAYIIINKIHFSYDFPDPQHMLGLKGYDKKGLDAYLILIKTNILCG